MEDGNVLVDGLPVTCAFFAASNGLSGALATSYGITLFPLTWHYERFCCVQFDNRYQTAYDIQDILISLSYVCDTFSSRRLIFLCLKRNSCLGGLSLNNKK